MLLIVEGPDGAGKTTFIQKVVAHRPSRVDHHGAYLRQARIAHHYMRSIFDAYRRSTDIIVMDRSWLAEPIYGAVMRGGADRIAAWERRMLERVAYAAGAVVVLCLPELETCERAWKGRLEKEYPQKREQLVDLHGLYKSLSGFNWPFDLIVYDYEKDNASLTIDKVMEKLAERSDRKDPTIGAPPSDRPVLLIGDSPGTSGRSRIDLPFVSLATTTTRGGCSPWLAEQLEAWGVPESDLAWVNQCDLHPYEFDDLGAYAKIVALGGAAASWCERFDVPADVTYHPQYWKRFHHHDEYPLKEMLT